MGEPRFGAVILAAGASTRLGQPKQLLVFRGEPLVVRAARAALEAGAKPVVVVLGAHAGKIRPALAGVPVLPVENSAWAEGMGATLRVGLTALCEAEPALGHALVALCDQPHFTADAVRRLRAALTEEKFSAAATRQPDDSAGAPAIFARKHFAALQALRGAGGARALLAGLRDETALVDLPGLALDIDTPDDWQRAQRDA